MMDHPMGAGSEGDFRLYFDRRVRLEFHGSRISFDGGLMLFRELDETFGRLAGYSDVNDADRLSRDPVMRQIVGGRAVDCQAASTSQMTRFETDILTSTHSLAALADLPGQWIDAMHDAQPPTKT